MAKPTSHTLNCPEGQNASFSHGNEMSASERIIRNKPVPASSVARAAGLRKNSVSIQRAEDIIAGLPSEVMASLVQDMAQAIVVMLLDQQVTKSDECDVESSDLRQI